MTVFTPLLTPSPRRKSSAFCNFILVIILCTTKFEKLLFILGVVFSILVGFCMPIESYAFGEVSQVLVTITNAINNKTIEPTDLETAYQIFEHDMNRVVFYFFICGVANLIFGFFQYSLMKFVGDNATYRLRKNYIFCLLRKDVQYFDNVSTGSLSTILNDNLERFREVFNEKIALIVALQTDFVLGMVLAFYTDWQLASYGAVFAVGIVLSGFINSSSSMEITEKQNEHYANAGSIAFQALGSFKTVCSLNGQQQEIKKYASELKSGEHYGFKKALYSSLSRGTCYFFSNALRTVLLYFGANMIYDGTLQPTIVIKMFYFMETGAYCLNESIPLVSRMFNAVSSIAPIAEVLVNDENEVEIDKNDVDDDVRFSYPTRPNSEILRGISLDVKNGECVALVGASGSGKSTIVQLLLHYYNINSGRILIDGIDLCRINLKKLRRIIGVVSQEPVLFNTTIEENIRFGNPNASLTEIYEALRKANAYDFVSNFPKGIQTIVGERGKQLSGGQKQRIAIARTLIRNPKILILDEATSALDNESEHVVQRALENASKGRTTIVIAHRLSTIRNATKIIVMEKGQIVETGNHDELIAKQGVYNNLVQAQLLNSSDTDEIIKQCRPDWFMLTIASLGSAIQGVCFPISAQLIIKTYEAYALEGEDILKYGHFWAFTILLMAVFRPLTLHCQYYYFGKVSEKLSTRLRIKSFKHLLSLPCSFYDDPKHSPTILSNRLNTDSSNVKAAVDDRLGCILMTFVAVLIAVTTSVFCSWKMTTQVLLICPILYLADYCYETAIDGAIEEDTIAFENSNRTATEALEHVRTVRALNMEDKVMNLITGHLQKSHNSYFKRAVIQGAANGFSCCCQFFFHAISFKFGTYLAMHNEVLPMDMYLVLMTLAMTSGMAGSATAYLPEYKKAVHAAGLIFHLFTYPASMPYKSTDGKKNIENGEVVGSDVHFHYNQRPDKIILDGINLEVQSGKTLALVGPSGCGKSTIISLLERFYEADYGEFSHFFRLFFNSTIVSFCIECSSLKQLPIGKNVVDINLHHLRASVALVSQEPTLFNCTIKENLLYGLTKMASPLEIEDALKIANASFVHNFPQGLETIVGERGAQLSGGQKQRIAIARAVLRKPKVLLLDEATSALDSESEKVVQNALDTASERLSTIIVAHRLSTIMNADSIAVMKNGRIVEQGTHQELLKLKNNYWRLVQNKEE
ncbi:hypothetical protein CAEBREN_32748 [Caenorhabditis brenneri]|uniref:Uncharacterized protein n=1 Tax=Caenorhabditis brenneri TaxID=135651 RepID=G0MHN3_CAEBE|nr:hypothetical protein CAEBREN_32748 [Caenorhabditis brenneri]